MDTTRCSTTPAVLGKKERDFVKQVNDELIERIIGQGIFYYPISIKHTNFHPMYGEGDRKNIFASSKGLCSCNVGRFETETTNLGIDRRPSIVVHFHKRRLTEDQDLFVREGDFVKYGDSFYEIVQLNEPKQIFGQVDHKMEVEAKCIKARKGTFNAK